MAMGRECRCSWWCWCWVDQVKMRMVWRGMRSLLLRWLGTWRCCVGAWLRVSECGACDRRSGREF